MALLGAYAERILVAARERFPEHVGIQQVLVQLYLQGRRNPGKALQLARELVSRHPEEATNHFLLALTEEWNGNRIEAINQLQAAIELDPSKPHYMELLNQMTTSK